MEIIDDHTESIDDHRVLRVGVVGVGMMGADHARRLAYDIAGAQLVAVADLDAGHARYVAAGMNSSVRAISDPLELIADPNVDAVLIASSVSAHEEQALACIAHHKPTLCEKPLTYDPASSLRIVTAEAALGHRLIQVGFMRRYDPEYTQMKAMLTEGRIGPLLLVHNIHRNRQVPDWFATEMIIRDSMVHEMDVARFLFGEEIDEVTVLRPKATSHVGMSDPLVAIFRMAGGAMVTTEAFVSSRVGYEVRCEAVGERGSIIIGQNTSGVYVTAGDATAGSWGGVIPPDYLTRFRRAYDIEVQAWVNATRAGTVVGPSTWDGYAATEACAAGVESLATGQPVEVRLQNRPQG